MKLLFFIFTCIYAVTTAQISFGNLSSSPSNVGQSASQGIIAFDTDLIYSGFEQTPFARTLYKTDGTPLNTETLDGSITGPEFLFEFNNKVYFKATQFGVGTEFFVTDGTPANTSLLKDIRPGSTGSSSQSDSIEGQRLFIANDTYVFFVANDGTNGNQLWRTDGTTNGTVMISNFSNGAIRFTTTNCAIYNNELYFSGSEQSSLGTELYKTDGNTVNLVKDINPAINSSFPNQLIVYNNLLYFAASTLQEGRELWVTNGTTSGTLLAENIYPENPNEINGSDPDNMTLLNGELFFRARIFDAPTNSALRTLVKYNGNNIETVAVNKIEVPSASRPVVFDDNLYFAARERDTFNSFSIWKTDGTSIGTEKIINNISQLIAPIVYGGNLYFKHNKQLWKTDGTITGSEELTNSNSNAPSHIYGSTIVAYDNKIWFSASKNSATIDLWYIEDQNATLNSSSITKENTITAFVYPNPTSDSIVINSTDSIKKLYDTNGKLLITTDSNNIDLSIYPNAIYFLEISNDNFSVIKKILKQ